ncbi:MAG TPA: hypothetical protein VMV49_13760 [Candidatus Deferrimicrobium sp.]|nr:hypothetical protein [Candidatus Deferrimicrobium sp.]
MGQQDPDRLILYNTESSEQGGLIHRIHEQLAPLNILEIGFEELAEMDGRKIPGSYLIKDLASGRWDGWKGYLEVRCNMAPPTFRGR